jgi:hypothetical protein
VGEGAGSTEGGDDVSGYDDIDITGAGFARRFASLLAAHRVRNKQYLWRLSRHSDGRFSVEDLQEIEAGRSVLDSDTVQAITELYGVTIESLLPPRVRLQISPTGTIGANGVEMTFDPDDQVAMLSAYLDLVRKMRDQLDRTVIELRREDVEVLADHLDDAGSSVVLQLARLMGANERERRAMAAMFIAGASVISVSTPKRQPASGNGEVVPLEPGTKQDPGRNHPARFHVVIPERDPEVGSVTVLADWQRGGRDT